MKGRNEMLHFLLTLDTQFFLFFNHAMANSLFDEVFPVITNGRFWIVPGILAALAFLYFKNLEKRAISIEPLIAENDGHK